MHASAERAAFLPRHSRRRASHTPLIVGGTFGASDVFAVVRRVGYGSRAAGPAAVACLTPHSDGYVESGDLRPRDPLPLRPRFATGGASASPAFFVSGARPPPAGRGVVWSALWVLTRERPRRAGAHRLGLAKGEPAVSGLAALVAGRLPKGRSGAATASACEDVRDIGGPPRAASSPKRGSVVT